MHFSLATIIAASALLFPSALAAPLPNNDAPQSQGSCSTDSGVNVGVGVGVGNSIYKPATGVKVKQGDQGSCPAGWTRSLLQVDLCIQVGGSDHSAEKPTHRAVHAPSPYWGARSTTTTNPQRASHTSAPQKDEWTPRGGNKKTTTTVSPSHSTTKSSSTRSSTPAPNKAVRPTSSPVSNRCPQGQAPGAGSLVDVCVDIDTDPLYIGGGIKIGGHNSPSSSVKGNSGSRTTSASPAPTPAGGCPDGKTYDALVGICLDINTDPLFLGGGIKIGGSPRPQTSSTTSSRNPSQTPRPSSSDGLPACSGPNDSRAILDLCVSVGDLLGATVKAGGDPSSSGPRSPQSTPYQKPKNGNSGNQQNSDKSPTANGSLPPCDGPDDPNALLNLCVQVGDLLGAGVKVGGSADAPASSSPSSSGDDDGNILDLNLGNLLNAKVGSGSSRSGNTDDDNEPTPPPRKVKQTAPIVTYHDNHPDSGSHPESPLVSVSAKVQVGPSSTPEPRRTTTKAPSPTPKATNSSKKDCPVGQILHLGICVEASADVLGLVSADAAATVAV